MIAKQLMFAIMTGMSDYNIHDVALFPSEVECLAMNVYHESRGESLAGKSAVAHVTLNRVESERYPSSICEVVYQAKTNDRGFPLRNQCQFSWYCDGRSDEISLEELDSWKISVEIALQAMMGLTIDPTSGATHYFNPKKASPSWVTSFERTAVLGEHEFYK